MAKKCFPACLHLRASYAKVCLTHQEHSMTATATKPQEELKQTALRSWQHYQQTGLHLTGEEMDVWLAKLEAGEHDAPMPQCHR